MKDLKDFENYLNQWCEENHKPNPGIDNINEVWKTAWDDFVKTELTEEYEERKEEYLNMKLLTGQDLARREANEKKLQEEKAENNDWEKVKRMMK